MDAIARFSHSSWDRPAGDAEQQAAVDALESGAVVLLPQLPFRLLPEERPLLDVALSGKRKNISFNPATGALGGVEDGADAAEQALLRGLLLRFATSSRALLEHLMPGYAAGLQMARTSFRPAEIEGRSSSWRKDDTRLHVDSFPSSPTQGTRILRVFSNINPHGKSRTWRLGAPFEDVARHFLPGLKPPRPGSSQLLQWLHITKSRRTAYDHYMLQLHDTMKADLAWQASCEQLVHEFEPDCTWMVYTDQASHAAMRGQHALEQTYHLPVAAMHDPQRSPLRVLERLVGRALV
jgi:hypothetical protein